MEDKENFDIYKLVYRNYKTDFFKMSAGANTQHIQENRVETINKILRGLENIVPKYDIKPRFSDVTYHILPVFRFNEKTNTLTGYEYVPVLVRRGEGDPNECIEKFKRFDINNLPLIEIAKYLNIKVEKSNELGAFGTYRPLERKITMGTDYEPVFIHELSHAIDFILPGCEYEHCYTEVIAELSAIVLCITYNIPIDIPNSLYYLNYHLKTYPPFETNIHKAINRVALIYEAVEEYKKNITNGNNDA
jgi:hypothetical protein